MRKPQVFLLTILWFSFVTNCARAEDSRKARYLKQLTQVMLSEEAVNAQKAQVLREHKISIRYNNGILLEQLLETFTNEAQKEKFKKGFLKLDRAMQAEFAARFNKQVDFLKILRAINSKIYGKYFTAAELKTIGHFFLTPAGKKMLKLGPVLAQRSMEEIDKNISSTTDKLLGRLSHKYMDKFRKLHESLLKSAVKGRSEESGNQE